MPKASKNISPTIEGQVATTCQGPLPHGCRYVEVPGIAEFASVALLPTPNHEPHGK
jgi:hypothetical protein